MMHVVSVAPSSVRVGCDDDQTVAIRMTFYLRPDGDAELAELPFEMPDQVPPAPSEGAEVVVLGHAQASEPTCEIPYRVIVGSDELRGRAHSELPLTSIRVGVSRFAVASLSASATIVLEGLVPGRMRLASHLPGLMPCAFVAPSAEVEARAIDLRPRRMVIDAERHTASVIWSGRGPSDADAVIVVGVQLQHVPLAYEDLQKQLLPTTARGTLIDGSSTLLSEASGGECVPFHGNSAAPPKLASDEVERVARRNRGRTQSIQSIGMPALPFGEARTERPPSSTAPPPSTMPPTQPTSPSLRPPLRAIPPPVAIPRPAAMPNDFGGGPVRAIAPNPLASMGYGSCPPPPAVEPPRSEPPSSVVVSKREDACPSPRSPDDVTIELCAAIRAAIDVHPSLEEAVLEQERLTREDWRTAEQRCRESLAAAVHRGEPELLASFDEAYLQRLEQERGPIDADTYAALELAIERGSSSDVIVDLGIPRPALIRVKRVWARRLVADAELRREVREAMTARRA